MNENLHDIDNYFRTALEEESIDPSHSVWERLDADLSKNEAKEYKRKYSNLKKLAAVFLFMLLSLVLYEVKPKRQLAKLAENTPVENQKRLNQRGGEGKKLFQDNHSGNNLNKEANFETRVRQSVFAQEGTHHTKVFLGQFITKKSGEEIQFRKPILANSEKAASKKTFIFLNTERHLSAENPVSGFFLKDNFAISDTPDFKQVTVSMQTIPSVHKKNPAKEAWAVKFYVSNDWSNYRLENNTNFSGQNEDIVAVKRREKHEPSMSGGFFVSRKLNNCISLSTGLAFSHSAIVIDPQKVYAVKKPGGDVGYKFNLSSGYTYIQPAFNTNPSVGDSMITSAAQHNLDYLILPVMGQFKKEKKRLGFGIAAGLSLNHLIHAKLKTEISTTGNSEMVSFSKLEGMRNMYLGFIADAPVEYRLSDHFYLSILPSFRYALTPITKDNGVKTFPYSYGLGVGARFKL